MDYKKINEKLKDLEGFRNSNTPVFKNVVKEIDYNYARQGESNEIYEVYDLGLENGLFVKLEIGSDSYGEEWYGYKEVTKTTKTISIWEERK